MVAGVSIGSGGDENPLWLVKDSGPRGREFTYSLGLTPMARGTYQDIAGEGRKVAMKLKQTPIFN